MNVRNKYAIGLLLATFMTLHCARTYAPRGWLDDPVTLQTSAYGGWITVHLNDDSMLSGELIAVGVDSLYIAGNMLLPIALANIRGARLVCYRSDSNQLSIFTVLGMLVTPFANGAFSLFTFPMWFIGGSVATSARSYQPVIEFPEQPWYKFRPFARFPNQLPHQLDRSQIVMKHYQNLGISQ